MASHEAQVNCFIKYFKSKNLLREDFAEMKSGAVGECENPINDYPARMERYLRGKAGPDAGKCFFDEATRLKFKDIAMRDEFQRATANELAWTADEVENHREEFKKQFAEVTALCSYPSLPEAFYLQRRTDYHDTFEGDKEKTKQCVSKLLMFQESEDCKKIIDDYKLHLGYRNFADSKSGRKSCKSNDANNYNAVFRAELAEVFLSNANSTEQQRNFYRRQFELEDQELSKAGVACDYETRMFDDF